MKAGMIILLILSDLDSDLIATLKLGLEKTFNRAVEVRYKIVSLEYAWEHRRNQYNSPRILSRLQRIKKQPGDKILGVVNVDLFSPEYDFVYGEAKMSTGVATLSVYRLRSDDTAVNSDYKEFNERALREAIHEVSHLYGLGHCLNSKCVMRACTCLEEVDRAGNKLCSQCDKALEIGLSPNSGK